MFSVRTQSPHSSCLSRRVAKILHLHLTRHAILRRVSLHESQRTRVQGDLAEYSPQLPLSRSCKTRNTLDGVLCYTGLGLIRRLCPSGISDYIRAFCQYGILKKICDQHSIILISQPSITPACVTAVKPTTQNLAQAHSPQTHYSFKAPNKSTGPAVANPAQNNPVIKSYCRRTSPLCCQQEKGDGGL